MLFCITSTILDENYYNLATGVDYPNPDLSNYLPKGYKKIGKAIETFENCEYVLYGINIDSLSDLFKLVGNDSIVIYRINGSERRSAFNDDYFDIIWDSDIESLPEYVIEIYDDYRE